MLLLLSNSGYRVLWHWERKILHPGWRTGAADSLYETATVYTQRILVEYRGRGGKASRMVDQDNNGDGWWTKHFSTSIKGVTSCQKQPTFPLVRFVEFRLHEIMLLYTECPGGNVPDFGRMFLKLKYTDITQNTYIRSWTVTEIMAREVWKYMTAVTHLLITKYILKLPGICSFCNVNICN